MQTIYLIGNGFDVNLGLKTKYQDFYNYYLGLDTSSDNENVKKLKKHLADNKANFWSDLESALGRFTTDFDSFAQMEEAYDDINDEMQKYISGIENAPLPSNIDSELLKKNLSSPESFLSPAQTQKLKLLYNNTSYANNVINIISFNYTTTIDRILGFKDGQIVIAPAVYNNSYKTIVNSILHIHGKADNPILGVDNASQISNEQMIKSDEILGYLSKPRINIAVGSLVDDKSRSAIKNSDLICIYGMSLGETDATWWKLVGERLLTGATVIIFVYDSNANNITARKIVQFDNKWQDRFFNVARIPDSKRSDLRSRVIIAPNTEIFDIRK